MGALSYLYNFLRRRAWRLVKGRCSWKKNALGGKGRRKPKVANRRDCGLNGLHSIYSEVWKIRQQRGKLALQNPFLFASSHVMVDSTSSCFSFRTSSTISFLLQEVNIAWPRKIVCIAARSLVSFTAPALALLLTLPLTKPLPKVVSSMRYFCESWDEQ